MTVQGVNGVLQTLLTPPVESGAKTSHTRQDSSRKTTKPAVSCRPATKARLGRPPQSSTDGPSRQKVTVRIRPDLIEGYRDWSWDARTSLSHLVEAALTDYFMRCGR